jgi:hypothetical protein
VKIKIKIRIMSTTPEEVELALPQPDSGLAIPPGFAMFPV